MEGKCSKCSELRERINHLSNCLETIGDQLGLDAFDQPEWPDAVVAEFNDLMDRIKAIPPAPPFSLSGPIIR